MTKLFGTSRSHFTRVVRILGHELGVELEWEDVGNVAEAVAFGGNPLMQVPTLVDGDRTLWGADNICRDLVERAGRDPLGITSMGWQARNFVETVRGVMNAEVRLVLAARTGTATVGPYFDKARAAISAGTQWIEQHLPEGRELDYPGVWAIAMWDHALLYELVRQSDAPGLESFVARHRSRPSIVTTRPR